MLTFVMLQNAATTLQEMPTNDALNHGCAMAMTNTLEREIWDMTEAFTAQGALSSADKGGLLDALSRSERTRLMASNSDDFDLIHAYLSHQTRHATASSSKALE